MHDKPAAEVWRRPHVGKAKVLCGDGRGLGGMRACCFGALSWATKEERKWKN